MLELALSWGKGPVLLKEIAEKQAISEKYLSQIIISLKASGLVISFRGARGGYALGREPSRITLREIVGALEGDFNLVDCVANPSLCDRWARCVTQDVWSRAGQAIADALEGITLQDLVDEAGRKSQEALSYTI